VALYDYNAEDSTELTIGEGDVLIVESERNGWYYGYKESNLQKKGKFPSNFVEEYNSISPKGQEEEEEEQEKEEQEKEEEEQEEEVQEVEQQGVQCAQQ